MSSALNGILVLDAVVVVVGGGVCSCKQDNDKPKLPIL